MSQFPSLSDHLNRNKVASDKVSAVTFFSAATNHNVCPSMGHIPDRTPLGDPCIFHPDKQASLNAGDRVVHLCVIYTIVIYVNVYVCVSI